MKSPIVPHAKRNRESSQGAKRHLTDGWHTKATFNRREAEMGFGDEIPKRGMGWQPHGNPVPQRKASPDGRLIRQSLIAIAPHRSPYCSSSLATSAHCNELLS